MLALSSGGAIGGTMAARVCATGKEEMRQILPDCQGLVAKAAGIVIEKQNGAE